MFLFSSSVVTASLKEKPGGCLWRGGILSKYVCHCADFWLKRIGFCIEKTLDFVNFHVMCHF